MDRVLWVDLARLWTGWRPALVIVSPDRRPCDGSAVASGRPLHRRNDNVTFGHLRWAAGVRPGPAPPPVSPVTPDLARDSPSRGIGPGNRPLTPESSCAGAGSRSTRGGGRRWRGPRRDGPRGGLVPRGESTRPRQGRVGRGRNRHEHGRDLIQPRGAAPRQFESGLRRDSSPSLESRSRFRLRSHEVARRLLPKRAARPKPQILPVSSKTG